MAEEYTKGKLTVCDIDHRTILGERGQSIAECLLGLKKETEANAAELVRRWNSHDALEIRLEESRRLGQEHKKRELANAKKCNEYYEQIKKLKKQHDSLKAKADSQPALLEALDQIANRKFLVDCDADERNQMVIVAKIAIAKKQ